jgi:purine-binding chemotaxis protein CheW
VPDLPAYMKGVINLRGKIIPVIDAGLKFGKPPVAYHDRTCIIILDIENALIGLIVDKVNEVIDIPEENVVPPPDGKTGYSNQFVKGIGMVGSDMKLLIDSYKIFSREFSQDLPNA